MQTQVYTSDEALSWSRKCDLQGFRFILSKYGPLSTFPSLSVLILLVKISLKAPTLVWRDALAEREKRLLGIINVALPSLYRP